MSWTLAEGLEEVSCEGLLVLAESSQDPDLSAFVGPVHLGESFLVVVPPAQGRLGFLTAMERDEAAASGLDLLSPETLGVDSARAEHGSTPRFWAAILRRGLELAGVVPTSLALAGRLPSGTSHLALKELEAEGWSFVDGTSLLRRHRRRKSDGQVLAIRRSASGVCAAFRRVAEVLAAAQVGSPGLEWEGESLTVGVLRRQIAVSLAARELSQPEGNIVAAGAAAGVPHTTGDDAHVLRPGEMIVVDLFPKGSLFADCTRTFCVGEPEAVAAQAFGLVREALDNAHSQARVGCRLWELQEATCDVFAAAGFPTPITHPGSMRGYVHGLGHGVGFELHEYPSFARSAQAEGVLESGDVFTLEPGLYDPEAGYGIRLEDLCLATADGIENLTPLPYDLDPRSWASEDAPGLS